MTHLDEGLLRALLDDETTAEEAQTMRAHIAQCGACEAGLASAREAGARTTSLLGALDVAAPTERVKARLGARSLERSPARRPWLRGADLAKAAVLLVGFAGMVTAAVHPASPLRRWLERDSDRVMAVAPTQAPEPTVAAVAARDEVGVRVALVSDGVQVSLADVPVGTALEVTWVDAGVDAPAAAVYAALGTAFSTSASEGRIEASAVVGPVRVELPRQATRASLVVDGRIYLEKTGERIDYPGPPALVDGKRVRFEVR